jgi:hypothetical protein
VVRAEKAAICQVAPTLDEMLDALKPGSRLALELNGRQRKILSTDDGKIALRLIEHVFAARRSIAQGYLALAMPLTELALQRFALRLGFGRIGIKRCRRMRLLLVRAGVIAPVGSYRQRYKDSAAPSGYRVLLYALFHALKTKHAVGRRPVVKLPSKPKTWTHPLFGDYDGLPPPQLSARQSARMRSQDEIDWYPRRVFC